MKNLNTTKRITQKLLFVSLLFLLLPCFAFGGSIQPTVSPALKVKVPLLKDNNLNKTLAPKDLNRERNLLVKVQVQSITFKTGANGDWLFNYSVKNIGGKTLEPHQVQYAASQRLTNGSFIPVHTVTTNHTLAPGSKISGCYNWDRCSNAQGFMLRVLYKGKIIGNLQVSVPPLNVKIKAISFGKDNKNLSAHLQNSTSNAVKVALRVVSSLKSTNDITAIIPANSTKNVSGVVVDIGNNGKLQALFKDEKKCSGAGFIVLDSKNFKSGGLLGGIQKPQGGYTGAFPIAVVQTISWNRSTKLWVATVKNNHTIPINVGIAGWPMENGVTGMTCFKQATIPANGTVQLAGDYSTFSVPVGTRLKVHVLLMPAQTKVHEKIIILN